MDGVLFDSMPYHAEAWHKAFKSVELDFSPYEVYLNEGRTGDDTIDEVYRRHYGCEASAEVKQRIYKIKSDLFNASPEAQPIANVDKVLEYLVQRNIQIMIVTGSAQVSLMSRINHYFPNKFTKERIICAFDVKHGKPHPEPYLKALERAEVVAEEAIVIENAPLGIKSAVEAGIFTIGVNTGILHHEDLSNAGAGMVVDNMLQVLDILQHIE